MTKKPTRTHPLDRDGDGNPGGSLPGNETAPMAEGADTAAADDVVEELAERLGLDPALDGADTIAADDTVTAEGADTVQAEADTVAAEGADTIDVQAAADAIDAAFEPDPDDVVEELAERLGLDPALDGADTIAADDTVTAEGADTVQAEADTVAAEGADTIDVQAATDAIDAAFEADPDDFDEDADEGLTDPDDDTPASTDTEAQLAVNVDQLRILVGARRLYKSPEGYSSNYGAPFLPADVIDAWIAGGLAQAIPSAGTNGGVKATAEARRQLGLAQRGEAPA